VLDDSLGKKQELDKRLGAELAQVGPGLTPAQRKEFISSFQKDHKYSELDKGIDSAASHLDTTLKANKPTLDESVKDGGANLHPTQVDPESGTKIGTKDVADAS